MTRLIIIVVVVAAVIWLVRRALAGPGAPVKPPSATEDELVACAQCGVNLPKTEARNADGHAYCSEEHVRLGPRSK